MKKILIAFIITVLGVGFASAAEESDYYAYSYARLSFVQGDVFIDRGAELGYEEGIINLPLMAGEKLGTQGGRAEVHFGRRNYLRLNRSALLDIVLLPTRGSDLVKLHLLSGSAYLRIRHLAREKDFELHTPDASFYILEEGLYRLDVKENSETVLAVLEGAVEAAGEEGSLLVAAEERLVATNGYLQREYGDVWAAYEDSFARWNRSRDELYARGISRTYLPEELYEYEGELADHGRWVYESPYGYVWVPHVYRVSWRPYHYGRWVWYPIIGWTWVSYEPWGWSVYHYGRWHWRLGLGWYWIPNRHWGPAWVHWYTGYDYIGWCPLSYYDYPVVIINNRFYGRYTSKDYPLNSWALTVVNKRQLQAPQISKVALSQARVTKLGKVSLSSRQPNLRPLANASSLRTSVASKALSRSNLRPVGKSYSASPGVRSLNRVNATKVKRSPSVDSAAQKLRENSSSIRKSGTISRSRLTSRTQPEALTSSRGMREATVRPSRTTLTRPPSNSVDRPKLRSSTQDRAVKNYRSSSRSLPPKKMTSTSSSARRVPKVSRTNVQSPAKRQSGNRSSSEVKSSASRLSVTKRSSSATNRGQRQDQASSRPSRITAGSSYRSSSFRSYAPRSTSSSSKRVARPSRSSSASPSRTSSRSFSSSQGKVSSKGSSISSKSSSAPRGSRSSSPSKTGRSSSSSRSSTSTKVKKK